MLTMQITVSGLPETHTKLERVKTVLNRMQPTLAKVGDLLLHIFGVEAFESEGAIYGKRWQALNPAYATWKATHYPGRGILERTGRLRAGFSAITSDDYLIIRNAVPYAAKHQFGRGVPQRTIMDIQERQRTQVAGAIKTDLLTRIREAL